MIVSIMIVMAKIFKKGQNFPLQLGQRARLRHLKTSLLHKTIPFQPEMPMSEKFDLVMEYFGKMAGKLLMTIIITIINMIKMTTTMKMMMEMTKKMMMTMMVKIMD